MATVWCRAGVKKWAELIGGVEVDENVWLCEAEGERYLLAWHDGRTSLTRVVTEPADV